MDYIITAFTMIFTIYGIYRYYRNVILLKNIKKMIMNLDQNIAIDIIKFCDCKYLIAQNNDIIYELDYDDKKFIPCPFFNYNSYLILYIINNKIVDCDILY